MINRDLYLPEKDIEPWFFHRRLDLTGPNPPLNEGKYLIGSFRVPPGQVIVIKTVMPYAQKRTNVGLGTESVDYIEPWEGDGFFLFEPRLAGKMGGTGFSVNYLDAMTIATGATNADVKESSGITFITDTPWKDVTYTIGSGVMGRKVASNQTMEVLFSLVQDPDVGADALPTRWVVPAFGVPPAAPLRRVDYAGILMAGLQMDAQRYDEELRKQQVFESAGERTSSMMMQLLNAVLKRLGG